MDVIGYSDKLSVRAGERVEFMISSTKPAYDVSIIRLDHSLAFPKEEQLAETIVPSSIAGSHPGRVQPINIGSAGFARHSAALEPVAGVTFAAWVLPTLPARGREQGIAAKWAPIAKSGYALLLDADGRLTWRVGDGSGRVAEIKSETPVVAGCWLHVAASHDAARGALRLVWREHRRDWLSGGGGEATGTGKRAGNEADVTLAALTRDGQGWIDGHFNGKIDRPALWGRALTPDEIDRLIGGAERSSVAGAVAIWDFSKSMRAPRCPR